MRIGIYAGTFDPIHKGHLAFAQSAVEQAKLDKVIIVAEKEPYRKKPHASWDHRQAMIERATEQVTQVDHDYHFANQLAYQHTMQNMLNVARDHFGDEHEYWFLVGSDIFQHMAEWQDVIKAEEYGGFVVALKHDHTKEWLQDKITRLKEQGTVCHVLLVDHQEPQASSSNVREAVFNNKHSSESIDAVTAYIRKHQLYTASSSGTSSGEGS